MTTNRTPCVTQADIERENLREAERVLAVQIADFEGEEVDPEDEPDLYLPLSAARALFTAWNTRQSAEAASSERVAILREALVRAAIVLENTSNVLRVANYPQMSALTMQHAQECQALTRTATDAEGGA